MTHAFLDALDAGQYQKAYDLETDWQRQDITFAEFDKKSADFNRVAGPIKEHRIVKVTAGAKDPAQAPAPEGVMQRSILVSRFENVDRHCGYIVLYHPDPAAPFRVAREDTTYMTNEAAREIGHDHGAAAVDEAWARAAANCPK